MHVVGAVRGVQQGFRPLGQVGCLVGEQHLAEALADRRPTRLMGEHDVVAGRGQPVREQPGLGGLARALAALEGDEQPRAHATTRH